MGHSLCLKFDVITARSDLPNTGSVLAIKNIRIKMLIHIHFFVENANYIKEAILAAKENDVLPSWVLPIPRPNI